MQDRRILTCPACGNSKWTDVYRIKQWTIGECVACGFARIDPLPNRESRPQLYSQEKVVSRDTKQLSGSQKFSRRMKRFFNTLAKRDKNRIFFDKFCRYLAAGSKILDIGCGGGAFLKLAKEKFDCTGIEISQYLAQTASQEPGIKVVTGDFQTADFAGNKFDGITLISLLEHLDDPLGAVKRCFNLLNDNGVLLLKTVNYGCLNKKIKKENWTGLRPPDHIVYFNPANLKSLLKKAGFRKIKTFSWPLNDNFYCDCRK